MAELENTVSELLTKIVSNSLPDALISRHAVALAEWKFAMVGTVLLGIGCLVLIAVCWWLIGYLQRKREQFDYSEMSEYDPDYVSQRDAYHKYDYMRDGMYLLILILVVCIVSVLVSLVGGIKEYILLSEPKAWALEYIKGLIPGVGK